MNVSYKQMFSAAAMMGLFSLIGIGLVTLVHHSTHSRIAENQRQTLLNSLQTLIPAQTFDNDMLADAIEIEDSRLGPKPVAVLSLIHI